MIAVSFGVVSKDTVANKIAKSVEERPRMQIVKFRANPTRVLGTEST